MRTPARCAAAAFLLFLVTGAVSAQPANSTQDFLDEKNIAVAAAKEQLDRPAEGVAQQMRSLSAARAEVVRIIAIGRRELDEVKGDIDVIEREIANTEENLSQSSYVFPINLDAQGMSNDEVSAKIEETRAERDEKAEQRARLQSASTREPETIETLGIAIQDLDSAYSILKNILSSRQSLEATKGQLISAEGRQEEYESGLTELEYVLQRLDDRIQAILQSTEEISRYTMISTGIFAVLVGGVIVAFFFIAIRSETVQNAVFTGDSGIQFVALFSLIIAIILFGILKILEGKELAALLGGLSGYILGRGSAGLVPAGTVRARGSASEGTASSAVQARPATPVGGTPPRPAAPGPSAGG